MYVVTNLFILIGILLFILQKYYADKIMNILQKSIISMSKEEIINYKLYANRTQATNNRKDILLFDLVKKTADHDLDDDAIFKKLYPDASSRNVYYQLKNRLLLEINNSLVQFYFKETDIHFIYGELSLYKIYVSKNEWEIALYHLNKAEKKALEIQDFTMLDTIYNEQINISVQYGDISPVIYKRKRDENRTKLDRIRTLDDALADIIYELKRNQTFAKTKKNTLTVLNKAIKDLNTKKELKDNLAFKIKAYNAISRLLLSKKDFVSLEQYAITTYNEFIEHNYFSKGNHSIKLQMLAYICNTLAANKKHLRALEYAELLHKAMKEFKNMLYNNYVFFYYNALANNYSVVNPPKAIEVLNEAKTNASITNHPDHLGYIYLNLAGAYFELKNFKTALTHLVKLYSHKLFNGIDEGFKLKIIILEIVLRIEQKDFEYSLKLTSGLLKTYKSILVSPEHKQDLDFLNLIKQLVHKYSFENNKASRALTAAFCHTNYKQGSTNIVKYPVWLSEKFNLSA